MISSGTNWVMTVIGFALSVMFIVFVCTRLICARIQLSMLRRSFAVASRSDLGSLERGLNGLEPLAVSNFPTKKYREFCLSSKESAHCSVCLAEYHEEDTLRILPACGHSFHATCIDIWLLQHSTCPVCRVSLRELPERKWFMQPMFSSAVQSEYCCNCMGNRPSRSHDNQIMDPIQEVDGYRPEGDGVYIGNTDSVTMDHNGVTKNSTERKLESHSDQ